ncbi:hypothetical protein EJB05_34767, partial [Eragrostis curvula]
MEGQLGEEDELVKSPSLACRGERKGGEGRDAVDKGGGWRSGEENEWGRREGMDEIMMCILRKLYGYIATPEFAFTSPGGAEEAREDINNWVSKATKELITSILQEGSVHRFTRLVLANAIYFKGTWTERFSKDYTKRGSFYRLDGSRVRVPFMSSRGKKFIDEDDDFTVLKLPYCQHKVDEVQAESDDERPQFSMVIFLPHERDGLPSLVQEMASSPSFLWDHLPQSREEVGAFRLPKFKLSFSSEINDVLKVMGIKRAFDEVNADFTDMLADEDKAKLPNLMNRSVDLYVEKVIHKAVIEVNEEGTEAVASTVCSSRKKQCARRSFDFVADHPFMFFVVEEVSSTIVFMGHVVDPTKSE